MIFFVLYLLLENFTKNQRNFPYLFQFESGTSRFGKQCMVALRLFISYYSANCHLQSSVHLVQGSGTYGSRARCDSFDYGIWLARYFLKTIVTDETFSIIFLQSHQQHHAEPEVALTVRSMLLKRKCRHLPLFKIVDFA